MLFFPDLFSNHRIKGFVLAPLDITLRLYPAQLYSVLRNSVLWPPLCWFSAVRIIQEVNKSKIVVVNIYVGTVVLVPGPGSWSLLCHYQPTGDNPGQDTPTTNQIKYRRINPWTISLQILFLCCVSNGRRSENEILKHSSSCVTIFVLNVDCSSYHILTFPIRSVENQ